MSIFKSKMLYCSRVVALRQGKVVYDGPSAHLTHAMLQDLYGTEFNELSNPVEVRPPANDETPFAQSDITDTGIAMSA